MEEIGRGLFVVLELGVGLALTVFGRRAVEAGRQRLDETLGCQRMQMVDGKERVEIVEMGRFHLHHWLRCADLGRAEAAEPGHAQRATA